MVIGLFEAHYCTKRTCIKYEKTRIQRKLNRKKNIFLQIFFCYCLFFILLNSVIVLSEIILFILPIENKSAKSSEFID